MTCSARRVRVFRSPSGTVPDGIDGDDDASSNADSLRVIFEKAEKSPLGELKSQGKWEFVAVTSNRLIC